MKPSPLVILVAGIILISGCANPRTQPVQKPAASSKRVQIVQTNSAAVLNDNRSEALARFAAGISYELGDNSQQALEQFYRAALADPSNESLALEVAQRLASKNQFDKAIEVLTKSSNQTHVSGDIFSALATIYLAAGRTNLAMTASQSAVKKSPDLISGYQTLAEIYLKTGQTNAVLKLLNSGFQQTNGDSLFLVGLGELYGDLLPGDAETSAQIQLRGLESLTRASSFKISDPNLRRKLADGFAQFGDLKKATELYLELLNEFSDMPLMRDALRERLTALYLRASDKTKAAEQLEAIAKDNPTRYPEAWLYLGNFAYDSKNYDKAREYFQRALLLNPDLEQAYYDLAGVQIETGQAAEALKILETARAKFPTSFTAEFFTGMALAHLKNYSEALKHYTAAEIIGKATDTNRLNQLFYFEVGSAHERNGNFEESEKYLQKSLELAPNFSDALNYLGFMWADRGVHLDKAREMIQKAVDSEPKNAAYLDSLGWVSFKLNQYESAVKFLLQAIESSDEPDSALYEHLGDVYSALKEKDKARAAWQNAFSLKPSDTLEKKLHHQTK